MMELNAAARLLSHKLEEEWVPGVRGYHNATGCILMAADTKRFNLQLRGSDCDTPNCYGAWGGSMDNNEEQIQALRREVAEETGYDGPLKIIPLMTYKDADRGFTYYNHLAVVPFEFEPSINEESNGHKWFYLDDCPGNLHPGLRSLFEDEPSMRIIEDAAKGKFGDSTLRI